MSRTTTRFSYLGYGLLEVWSLCALYSRAAGFPGFYGTQGIDTGYALSWEIASVAVVIATFFIVIIARGREDGGRHDLYTIIAAILNVIGSVLILLGPLSLGVAGLVLASLGNAWLWIAWGNVYTCFDTETVENTAMGSAILQVVIVLAVLVSPGIVGSVVMLLAAPLSCILYLKATKSIGEGHRSEPVSKPDMKKTQGSFYACLAIGLGAPIALAYFWWGTPFATSSLADNMSLIIAAGLLVFLAVFLAFIRFSPSVSVSFICRMELALVVIATVLASLGVSSWVGVALVFATMLVSQYLLLLYGARLYSKGFGSVVFTFGTLQLINHGFGWLGSIGAAFIVVYSDQLPLNSFATGCVICAVAFFVVIGIQRDSGRDNVSSASVLQGAGSNEDALEELAASYSLTVRETEIFLLLARGRSAPFIRDELVISLNTVASHLKHIYSKMGVNSRQELLDLVEKTTLQ